MLAGMPPHSALALSDPGEAAAAAELERLRADVREKEGRIDRLADSTDKLDRAVQEQARLANGAVPAGDVAALHVRIKHLEEEKALVEREKEEVEKKVAAHVAHAQKIRNTYNQLAGWYNNLRKEHVELQAKHPSSIGDQTTTDRELPQDVPTTHEAEIHSLERERNELQDLLDRERSEKKEFHSRNSELLESKAQTLAELREQWDVTQNTLSTTQRSKEEQAEKLHVLEQSVTELQAQLEIKEAEVSQRSRELADVTAAREMAMSQHEHHVQQAVKAAVDEAKAEAERELDEQIKRHEEAVEQLRIDADSVQDTIREEQRSGLKAEFDEELERIKKNVEDEQAEMYAEKLSLLHSERDTIVEEREENVKKALAEAKESSAATAEARQMLEEKLTRNEKERLALEEKVRDLMQSRAALEEEKSRSLTTMEEAHRNKVAELHSAKEHVEAELSKAQEALEDEKKVTSNHGDNERVVVAVQEELRQAKAEVEALQKENAQMQSSPRDVQVTESGLQENASTLEREISELRVLLKRESDKKSEATRLLQNADAEHDELRAMVTRLRSERDEAQQGAKLAKNEVPNTEVGPTASRSASNIENHIDSCNFLEERDKALRELFRVRKSMKKEISRLKKEKDELSRKAESENRTDSGVVERSLTGSSTPEASEMKTERDHALAELQQLRASMNEAKELRSAELSRANDNAEASIGVLKLDMEAFKDSAKSREESLEAKIAKLDQDLKLEVSSSHELSEKLHRSEASLVEEQSKLHAERLAKEKETTRLGTLLENLKSQEASLSTELATEKGHREEMYRLLSVADTKLAKLETELSHGQESRRENLETIRTTAIERDQAQEALKEAEKRLEVSEMRVSDLQQELSEAKDKLRNLESSREYLQKEASEVGGRNQAVGEEVAVLRADLKQTQVELSKALRDLDIEVQKGSHRAERENASALELQKQVEALTAECNTMQSKYDDKVKAYQAVQESRKNLDLSLNETQASLTSLEQVVAEKDEKCHRLEAMLSDVEMAQQQTTSKLKSSDQNGSIAKQELERLKAEINSLTKEKAIASENVRELSAMRDQLGVMYEENAEMVLAERERADRETKKAADLRKEVQNARLEADNLSAEMEELQARCSELRKENVLLKEVEDEHESDLTKRTDDLISSRVQLAYAQEEVVRLRNRLRKLAQSGQGSLSFEQ